MTDQKFDAIVVGSGAGGGTAARVLVQHGQRVIVFEKGPLKRPDDFLPYDELHYSEHKALIPSKQSDPMMYVDPVTRVAKKVERWWIGNMVGGATMLWEANLPRYTAEDFSLLDVMPSPPPGTSQINWPWSYDEFQPWFEMAEWEWGVSGQAPTPGTRHMQEPTRPRYQFPMPPLRPHASTPFLQWAFGRAGMLPFSSPRGINTRTFNGRPGCPYCGFCQGYGCAVNDRASSTNTVLATALRSGLCTLKTEHCVTRILYKSGVVEGVAYKDSPSGQEFVVKAPRVFVSIQALESARLFLISGIPDPNKLIGRYLTYHTKGNAELTFKGQPVWDDGPQRLFQPRTSLGSLQLRDLYVIRDKQRPELTKGGKFSIYDPFTISPLIKCVTRAGGAKKSKDLWGNDLIDRLVELRNQGGVMFSFTGETMSLYDNRVELDKDVKDPWGLPVARVNYKHHDYDLAISKYCMDRVCQIMVEAGGELRKFEPQAAVNEGYGHNHGTLRAGRDPWASVLDENCESHTVKGLYVLDSAFMPTAGASNPTLTQIANAYRVCHGLFNRNLRTSK